MAAPGNGKIRSDGVAFLQLAAQVDLDTVVYPPGAVFHSDRHKQLYDAGYRAKMDWTPFDLLRLHQASLDHALADEEQQHIIREGSTLISTSGNGYLNPRFGAMNRYRASADKIYSHLSLSSTISSNAASVSRTRAVYQVQERLKSTGRSAAGLLAQPGDN